MTFAGGQLPATRATHALVPAGAAASHAAQVAFGARAHVAIVSGEGWEKKKQVRHRRRMLRECFTAIANHTRGRMSYGTGRFAATTASGTSYSWCGTRIRCRDVDRAGTSRTYRIANPDRNRPNIVPRTCPALGTWSATGKTGSFDRRSRCTSRTIRDTIYTACRSRTDQLSSREYIIIIIRERRRTRELSSKNEYINIYVSNAVFAKYGENRRGLNNVP